MKVSIFFRRAAAIFLMAQALSIGLAAGPKAVWCHKADGRIEVELEIALAKCACEKCVFYRESRPGEIPGHDAQKTILKALSCTHEEILSDWTRAAAPEKRNQIRDGDSGVLCESGPAGLIRPMTIPLLRIQESYIKAPPPAFVALRC